MPCSHPLSKLISELVLVVVRQDLHDAKVGLLQQGEEDTFSRKLITSGKTGIRIQPS